VIRFTSSPRWRTLSAAEKAAYLDAHAAPADWRALLEPKSAERTRA
jgi:hypothetical protein